MSAGRKIDPGIQMAGGIASYQQGQIARPALGRLAIHSDKPQDIVAAEATILLEDVRLALDCNMSAAAGMAGRLLEILTAGVSRQNPRGHVQIKLVPWKMRKVERYIEDHLEESILIADLATLVSLSASYFCRAFKASFGETPHSYIMRAKIERARTMMLTTTLGLSQIAVACGLADQSHLCRCFRQITGTTPAVWRRTHAGETDATALMQRPHSTKCVAESEVRV